MYFYKLILLTLLFCQLDWNLCKKLIQICSIIHFEKPFVVKRSWIRFSRWNQRRALKALFAAKFLCYFLLGKSAAMKIERAPQTCLNENRKKKFPQSLQRCAERKADFQYSACFPRFWFTFDCIKIALDSLRRKVNVEKTRHAIEILFRLKGSNDQENHFWSEKCVNLKRRDIKFLVRAKKNHCLWFLSPSRLILSKNSLRVYVYEKKPDSFKEDE